MSAEEVGSVTFDNYRLCLLEDGQLCCYGDGEPVAGLSKDVGKTDDVFESLLGGDSDKPEQVGVACDTRPMSMCRIGERMIATCSAMDNKWIIDLYSVEVKLGIILRRIPNRRCRIAQRERPPSYARPSLLHVCKDSSSQGSYKLNADLFNSFLSLEERLIAPDVLVIGCPDGLVHALPLKSSGFQTRIICDLEQSVIDMLPVFLRVSPHANVGLAMIGACGKLVLLYGSSDGSDVLVKEVQLGDCVSGAVARENKVVAVGYKVVHLCEFHLQQAEVNVKLTSVDADVSQVSWTDDNTVKLTKADFSSEQVSIDELRVRDDSRQSFEEASDALADILMQISACARKLAKVNESISRKDDVLRDLQHASKIFSALNKPDKLLRCDFSIRIVNCWPRVKRYVIIVLKNVSDRQLSSNWKLAVSVLADGEAGSVNSFYPLSGIISGSKQKIPIDVTEATDPNRLMVKCFLVYSFPADHVHRGTANSVSAFFAKTECFLLDRLAFDKASLQQSKMSNSWVNELARMRPSYQHILANIEPAVSSMYSEHRTLICNVRLVLPKMTSDVFTTELGDLLNDPLPAKKIMKQLLPNADQPISSEVVGALPSGEQVTIATTVHQDSLSKFRVHIVTVKEVTLKHLRTEVIDRLKELLFKCKLKPRVIADSSENFDAIISCCH